MHSRFELARTVLTILERRDSQFLPTQLRLCLMLPPLTCNLTRSPIHVQTDTNVAATGMRMSCLDMREFFCLWQNSSLKSSYCTQHKNKRTSKTGVRYDCCDESHRLSKSNFENILNTWEAWNLLCGFGSVTPQLFTVEERKVSDVQSSCTAPLLFPQGLQKTCA